MKWMIAHSSSCYETCNDPYGAARLLVVFIEHCFTFSLGEVVFQDWNERASRSNFLICNSAFTSKRTFKEPNIVAATLSALILLFFLADMRREGEMFFSLLWDSCYTGDCMDEASGIISE